MAATSKKQRIEKDLKTEKVPVMMALMVKQPLVIWCEGAGR